jgi:hypothetical protein
MILITPMPVLWNLRVSLRRKLGLSLLLFPGVFVIAAALIRVIMTLEARPSALNINRWGVRETLAGIIAVNFPILRPILLRAFWTPGGMPGSDQESSHNKSRLGGSSNARKWTLSTASVMSRRGQQHLSSTHELPEDVEVQDKSNVVIEMSDHLSECSNHSGADSDDFIIQRPSGPLRKEQAGKDGVHVETTFASTVEYRHPEFRPAVYGGIPREDKNYITSVTHSDRK